MTAAQRDGVLSALADMAADARCPFNECECCAWHDEARAAVAELVEADKEYDAANAAWTEAQVNSTGDENPGGWRKEAAKQWQRFGEASRRRTAALARMDPQPGEGA